MFRGKNIGPVAGASNVGTNFSLHRHPERLSHDCILIGTKESKDLTDQVKHKTRPLRFQPGNMFR